jgi:hypothetical protein
MDRRIAVAIGFLVCLALPAFAADEEKPGAWIGDVSKTALTKGGEVAVKLIAGAFYDSDCKNKRTEQGSPMEYICAAFGSFSGRTEAEEKARMKQQLNEISAQLSTIEAAQRDIQRELTTQHKVAAARFHQVSANNVAVKNLVRVEGLWEKFQAQFDKVDHDVKPEAMVSFAKEILASKPHTILGDLNAVLTKSFLNDQPLPRYPFYEWSLENPNTMVDKIDLRDVYDFAEKEFLDFRMREAKAYSMYLWAARVLETQCTLDPQHCTRPPRAAADFQNDYQRYTEQQVAVFNAAVDWLLLSRGITRVSSDPYFLPSHSLDILARANFVTSMMFPERTGVWGRVIAMGNAWDGALAGGCTGTPPQPSYMPVMKYSVPVAGTGMFISGPDSGPLDWWTSSTRNSTFDEVHFSNQWQIYIYNLPGTAASSCGVPQGQPGLHLPWVQKDIPVLDIKGADGKTFPFGSFVAIQRAGGTYGLMSGATWQGNTTPEKLEEGLGERKNVQYDWLIEPGHSSGPWVGLSVKGRGEFKVSNGSSRIHDRNKIELKQSKTIRFPDDRTVNLKFFPGNCKGSFCYPASDIVLSYDIQNNDTPSKQGQLTSTVAVAFRDPATDDAGSGIVLDGSYGKTGDRKQKTVSGGQMGVVNTQPDKRYQLAYRIYFDLETEGRGLDATEYSYRALLAPGSMFLTK